MDLLKLKNISKMEMLENLCIMKKFLFVMSEILSLGVSSNV